MSFLIRKFAEKDLPAIASLLNETYAKSYEFVPYTTDSLNSWIKNESLEALVADENSEVLGSAAYNDGHWGEEIEWLVIPRRIRQSKQVQAALVQEIEKHVKRGRVFTVVDAGSSRISDWVELGYNAEGGLYHMVADLNGAQSLPQIPEGITLRNLKPEEEKEFVDAVNLGFGSERVKLGVIQMWKTDCPIFDESWIHVAECEGKIVSAVISRPDTRYNKNFNGGRGYLGPAATLPEYRNRHLCSALTCRAMSFLFEKGMDSVALYTSEQNVSSTTLLHKIGFRIGHHWKFLKKDLS